MDLAAVVAAGARAKGRVATAAVSNLNRRPPAGVMRFFRVTPNHDACSILSGEKPMPGTMFDARTRPARFRRIVFRIAIELLVQVLMPLACLEVELDPVALAAAADQAERVAAVSRPVGRGRRTGW